VDISDCLTGKNQFWEFRAKPADFTTAYSRRSQWTSCGRPAVEQNRFGGQSAVEIFPPQRFTLQILITLSLATNLEELFTTPPGFPLPWRINRRSTSWSEVPKAVAPTNLGNAGTILDGRFFRH